ncbi:uncharacterized protein LOC132619404 [Lycium barbarum]|uniref:uncharacterized protein LOC132619404 n=1 Tax=Lycium barbarum TaxID=112863 RepID=UPI00293F5CC4|nr:uncharacterized protein LOC132619404 [Lycium barbarum]
MSAGGLHLSNLQVWNRAAITKTHWDLTFKQDKLWIKWIHAYYMKRQRTEDVVISQTASWMVREISGARDCITLVDTQFKPHKSLIHQIYIQLLPTSPRTNWRALMFQNSARPKAKFTMWLQCHSRLLTVDRLVKWGTAVETNCVFCQQIDETRYHIFAECPYAKQLWTKLLTWMKIQSSMPNSWTNCLHWIIPHAKGKSRNAKAMKMVYAEFIHTLWLERKAKFF